MTLLKNQRSPVVLCVDDDPDDLSVLRTALWDSGDTFVGAACGEDCLRIADRSPPRVILLDIDMPGLGGLETCRRLRENPAFKTIPIVFLSATETHADVTRGLALGGNDFIVKPIHGEAMRQRVAYWAGDRVGIA